jgi:hypothetical protein
LCHDAVIKDARDGAGKMRGARDVFTIASVCAFLATYWLSLAQNVTSA